MNIDEATFKHLESKMKAIQHTIEVIEMVYKAAYNEAIDDAMKWLKEDNWSTWNSPSDPEEILKLKK